ncbi:MAG: tetraacyldisaccharide 4'-kinase [Burkholderiales bacterium]|jgi:tetraacyldisaccharide 4'-kinase|nr:tetraacyldisaccharide 4'-kinase [Burkholderiales bacterium]
MTLRARLEPALTRAWTGRGLLASALLPLSLLYVAGHAIHGWLYRGGLLKAWRVGLPVVVVGNLYAGGTGKTPLVIELVRQLKARGWRPGVISRGYGRRKTDVRPVDAGAQSGEVGDEPLLIAQRAGVPVVVGADRVAAARVLHSLHPKCDVIVSDDGLQHPRLAREVEIAVLHFLGIGNGWPLPAGPLRDSLARLRTVDAVVLNGDVPPLRIHGQVFSMEGELDEVYSLADPTRRAPLAALVDEQRRSGTRVVAAAGIAAPEKFFSMLRAAGLAIEEQPLPDHHDFAVNPFFGREYDVALVTEKDAVKCRASAATKNDGRICAVSLRTRVDPALVDLIEAKIRPTPRTDERASNGPSPA